MPEYDDHIHPEAAVALGYLANHAARVFNGWWMRHCDRTALE